MRFILGAIVLLAAASPALAERPNTSNMSCEAATQKVLAGGAVMMQIGPVAYERFVASRAFCAANETIEAALVPTRDNPSCAVGYRCREIRPSERR